MKKKGTVISRTLSIALLITSLPLTWSGSSKAANDYGLENPKVAYLTRDIVEFGHYWQEDTNGDGVANTSDAKTPIRWQVLERNGDELLLLSDKILDRQQYNSTSEAITWKLCSLRTWLNGEFYDNAFSSVEKNGIKECNITNSDNTNHGTDGGDDTKDRLFLLSLDEIIGYGFNEIYGYYDQARHGEVTAYAKGKGLSANVDGVGVWWLRSPGYSAISAAFVDSSGYVRDDRDVTYGYGVRPTLRINLSSLSGYVKDAGTENVALKASTWDTVTFGSYGGNTLTWRVLNINGNEALLLSENIMDTKKYNEESAAVTWNSCTLRTWLNNDFYNSAFTSTQKNAIRSTTLVNSDNPNYGTSGGNNTSDKIYLLSLSEITNPKYGFPDAYNCQSESRTAYIAGSSSASDWWLRSPGNDAGYAAIVYNDGYVPFYGFIVHAAYGVRPALHINLSSSVWTKGDKIIAGDAAALATSTPTATPTSSPSPSPTASPTVAPTAPPTSAPTATPDSKPTEQPTQEPTEEPEIMPTVVPETIPTEKPAIVSESPAPTPGNNAVGTPTPNQASESNTDSSTVQETIKKGMKFFVGNLQYKVTSVKNNQYEVSVIKVKNKRCKSITIDSVIKYRNNNFIISSIGKKFASGCTKLKKINLRSKYIKKIEKKAFAEIKSKYKILVVKSKLKKYASMIKKAK